MSTETKIDTAALAAEIRQGPEAYGGEITKAEFDALIADGYNPRTGKLVRSTFVDYENLNAAARKLYDSAYTEGYHAGDSEGSSRTAFYHGQGLLGVIEQMLSTCRGADAKAGHLLTGYAQRLIGQVPYFNIRSYIREIQVALVRARPKSRHGTPLPPLDQVEVSKAFKAVERAREEYAR